MFTSLKTFGWVSWQEVREKDTGRKAATQVMNFREPSRHAEAPPSLPSSPPTQSGDKICGQNHDRHLRWGRKRWRHSGASLNFLCLIDYNDVTTQAVAIPTSALAATVSIFFFLNAVDRLDESLWNIFIHTWAIAAGMWSGWDNSFCFVFLLFSRRCSQCGTRLSYSWKRSAETKGFFLELCTREKVKIPCFNWHLEDWMVFLCYGVTPAQFSGLVNLVPNLKLLRIRYFLLSLSKFFTPPWEVC